MPTKPMYEVEPGKIKPSLKTYILHMPDGLKWRYAYGQWFRIKDDPLARCRELKPKQEQSACIL